MDSDNFTFEQVNLMKEVRRFWEQQVMWMRFFIISTVEGLKDLPVVTQRLFLNPRDFYYLLRIFFGDAEANRFADFLTFHMSNLGHLLKALMNNDQEAANRFTVDLNRNAKEMASFLSQMNPYWEEERWTELLYNLVSLTINQMVARIAGNYAEDIEIFDKNEENAYKIADYLSKGIIYSFAK
ncbi:MAG: hypothetical protein ACOX4P_07175 [Anaerovoracaceae bacterium]|jgi:hypothetical protein